MIAFRPGVKITCIDSVNTDSMGLSIHLHFNTGYNLIAPKSIFDLIYMLNGQFTIEHIETSSVGHTDLNSKEILDDFFRWGIIHEIPVVSGDKCIQGKNKLCGYTVHFPKISNINITLAMFLQKICVKSCFYDNKTISQCDVNQNIYINSNDIGKNIVSFLRDEMKIDTIEFSPSILNEENLCENCDIVVNSDVTDWINSENCIIINAWDYYNAQSDDSRFIQKDCAVENMKALMDEYLMAIRTVDDIAYSVAGKLVF